MAVDLSAPQLAACELRIAAWRRLDREHLLGFLGVTPAGDRERTYRALVGDLSPRARGYWDSRIADVERGIIHAGKFERYLRSFRRFVLPLTAAARRTIGANSLR